jgi:hypothetical protein
MYYARQVEVLDCLPQTELLDEAARVYYDHPINYKWKGLQASFLGYAVERNLRLYLADKLKPELVLARSRPLLNFALNPSPSKYSHTTLEPDTVQLLLDRGALPNQPYGASTVWGHSVCSIRTGTILVDEEDLFQIVEMLPLHGANVEQKVIVDTVERRQTGRAADLYRPSTVIIYKSAREIIFDRLNRRSGVAAFKSTNSEEEIRLLCMAWLALLRWLFSHTITSPRTHKRGISRTAVAAK